MSMFGLFGKKENFRNLIEAKFEEKDRELVLSLVKVIKVLKEHLDQIHALLNQIQTYDIEQRSLEQKNLNDLIEIFNKEKKILVHNLIKNRTRLQKFEEFKFLFGGNLVILNSDLYLFSPYVHEKTLIPQIEKFDLLLKNFLNLFLK